MGGFFGAASQTDCVFDLFFGIDYHSHLGTRRAGMAVYSPETGFDKAIHNIETLRSARSLQRNRNLCTARSASAASPIMKHSRF